MSIPFTIEEFLRVFQNYNLSVWPLHIVVYFLGLTAVLLTFKKTRYGDKTIGIILAIIWLVNGCLYHLTFFTSINKAAYVFGPMFILQGIFFLRRSLFKGGMVFGISRDVYSVTGVVFIVYALAIYPLLGILGGHGWPQAPLFGVAPCPTNIFTYGMLLLTRTRVPKFMLIVPLAWSFVGLSAAINFGIYEDFGLLLAGLTGTSMVIARDRKKNTSLTTAGTGESFLPIEGIKVTGSNS